MQSRTLFATALAASLLLACGGTGDTAGTGPGQETTTGGAVGGSLNGRRPFPADNPWNTDISALAVDPNSSALIASCGIRNLHPDFGTSFGIPYVLVGGSQPLRPISFDYAGESDAGPYPIPSDAPVEGGASSQGDRHVLVVDTLHWTLFELYDAHPVNAGVSWHAGSGAIFDLASNRVRPLYWTSADAAGLPIFPGLVRYDETVQRGVIQHALRFTCPRTQKGFIAPARHYASSDTASSLPPMGMRVRLRASFDVSSYPSEVQVILRAMKTHGLIVADNGSGWFVSGAPDARWNDTRLDALKQVPSSAFEVVRMGAVTR